MIKRIAFDISNNPEWKESTNDYFINSGFIKNPVVRNDLVYQKGNFWMNMVTFNPLNWKSRVTITLQNSQVVADFDINTTGQMVTPKEEKLWDHFIENYMISVVNKTDLLSNNKKRLQETKQDSFQYLKWALLGAVIFGIPAALFAYFTESNGFYPTTAAIVGAIWLMQFRIKRGQQKDL